VSGEAARIARFEVTVHDTATGTTIWFTSNERTDVGRLMRSMVTFGAAMAGTEIVRGAEPALPTGEGEAAGKDGTAAAVKEEEKEKEDEAGKKKRRKKGKR
jgi:hypothetical protein